MYRSSYQHNGKSKEWTWIENKIFETNLLEYLEGEQEGQWENLTLVCGRSTEVKEQYKALLHDLALIEEGLIDFPTDSKYFISKVNASIDKNLIWGKIGFRVCQFYCFDSF